MLKHLRIWNIGFLYTVIHGWPRLIQLVYATIESYEYYSSKEIKAKRKTESQNNTIQDRSNIRRGSR